MKTQKQNAVDSLVCKLTAFGSWNEMVEAMRGGYIPSLMGGKAYAKLCDICRRNGFKVYRNGRVS